MGHLSFALCLLSVVYLFKRIFGYFTAGLSRHMKVQIVSNDVQCNENVKTIYRRCSTVRVLGFDCEWVTIAYKRQPIALLQLSTQDGLSVLFQISQLKSIPLELKGLLEDSSILKVGVAPITDAQFLLVDYDVKVRGCVDLRYLHGNDVGLAKFAKELLGFTLDKSVSIRCSDWESEVLNRKQIQYAAQDAYAAIKIFNVLINRSHSADDPPIKTWHEILDLCGPFIDLPYIYVPKKVPCKPSKPCVKKKKSKRQHPVLQKPLYDSASLTSSDGSILCTCSKQKANWYLKKNLGEKISDDPLKVRLLFEQGPFEKSEEFQYCIALKRNCCTVCGCTETNLRKYIVPGEYRKHFPAERKYHQSHDVLVMCLICHQICSEHDMAIRAHLEDICQAPILAPKMMVNPEIRAVRLAAKALRKNSHLPEARQLECHNLVVNYIKRSDYDVSTLTDIIKLSDRIVGEPHIPHGFKVVQAYKNGEGLNQLELLWRENFIKKMSPRFLPQFWSVTFGHKNKSPGDVA